MSRIGKKPVPVPKGVEVDVAGNSVRVKGPKGELSQSYRSEVSVKMDGDSDERFVIVEQAETSRSAGAFQGLYRSLINNMVVGVSEGYSKKLLITGVGYRAQVQGNNLVLNIGFNKPQEFAVPEGITIETPQPIEIVISGIDKQLVGETAACVRKIRPVEPYKGKGIRYDDEIVRRKVGKAAVGGGG